MATKHFGRPRIRPSLTFALVAALLTAWMTAAGPALAHDEMDPSAAVPCEAPLDPLSITKCWDAGNNWEHYVDLAQTVISSEEGRLRIIGDEPHRIEDGDAVIYRYEGAGVEGQFILDDYAERIRHVEVRFTTWQPQVEDLFRYVCAWAGSSPAYQYGRARVWETRYYRITLLQNDEKTLLAVREVR